MTDSIVFEKTEAEGNVLGHDKIEIVEFNYDGKGSALVRWDSDPDLSSLQGEELDLVLFGDPGSGTRFYRLVSELTPVSI